MTKISATKLDVARARLIIAVGHDVEWRQFADWASLSPHTIAGIRNGRSAGSTKTVRSIIEMLRDRGVNILTDDLLESV